MFSVALRARRHLKQRARESRLRVKGEERKEISLEQSQGFFLVIIPWCVDRQELGHINGLG